MKKRIVGLLFLVCTIIGLQGCSKVEDKTITQNIQAAVNADPKLSQQNVGILTTDGVVLLTGEVETEEQKQRLISIVTSVEGVKNINVQVAINPPPFQDIAPTVVPITTPTPTTTPNVQTTPSAPTTQTQTTINAPATTTIPTTTPATTVTPTGTTSQQPTPGSYTTPTTTPVPQSTPATTNETTTPTMPQSTPGSTISPTTPTTGY